MSIRRFFQVGILVILSPLAIGFGGDEHREISDLALSVAIDYHCSQAGKSQTEKCRKLRMAVDELTADSTEDIKEIMTYGKINEVVDFRRCTNNCVTGYLNERRNHDQSQRY
jgi:hypothetical protein